MFKFSHTSDGILHSGFLISVHDMLSLLLLLLLLLLFLLVMVVMFAMAAVAVAAAIFRQLN